MLGAPTSQTGIDEVGFDEVVPPVTGVVLPGVAPAGVKVEPEAALGGNGVAAAGAGKPKAKAKAQKRKRRIEALVKDSDDEDEKAAEGLLTQKN